MNVNAENQIQAHPFARTLEEGPYTVHGTFDLGAVVSMLQSGNASGHMNAMANAPRVERGMGTCAHCGHAIMLICIVRIGDGKLFGVGSDCILKVGLPEREISKLERYKRTRARTQRAERKIAKGKQAREVIKALIETDSERLKALPHPNEYQANKGLTLLDYAEWAAKYASDGASPFTLRTIETKLKGSV